MIADEMTWKETKRKVGEMASMENDLRQAQASRDYWKNKCDSFMPDVGEHYTHLPIDAGGGTIRPGARVMHDGKVWVVRTLMLGEDGWWLLDCQPEDGEPPTGRTIKPEDCVVVEKRRTVEDVLSEFAEAIEGQNEDFGSLIVKRYADEIRQMLDD